MCWVYLSVSSNNQVQLNRLHCLIYFISIFNYRMIKGSGTEPKLCYTGDFHNQGGCCHLFYGLHFIPYICKPWSIAYSRRSRRKYMFNTETKESAFDFSKEAFSSTDYSLAHRMLMTDKHISTKVGLADLTIALDEWITTLAPWLAST